ncbi:LacI family DNA-binding transcriptional regulator [Verminephrobacter aporrectodeae subsp. tuberculatae]|uniref:LacI family DNA-binding transcriptional regulator n=1 Tax=Verminephrobacter aporrectodeae TaxID=1110389 RepID=UPI0022430B42|nr:LacI family DNA-binding transcriptional regulator [Verminephrobacter aporrectodeae]MCW8166167.1 LacI family DNA-binding transcriptional regulator [Verminephrobacter aporrectodeae subsp. tuberculatae]MCW8170151.1 LacI family DNA-binding transcriptional regulator [Verminephrobacter aporrectodeae subsp. tuberculatae]
MDTRENKRPTIDDVAQMAGVSTATVSRVLNQPGAVREALRKNVLGAVARLGYVPHAGARALMLHRTGTVGAVFPTVDNAIFAQAIDALQRRLALSEVHLLIATSGYDPGSETRQAVNLVTRGVDALALCGFSQHPDLLHFLQKRGLPCVHVMVHQPDCALLSVGFDNAAATARATRYLIDLGHRRIAMLAGITQFNDRAAQRLAGVRQALASIGLELPPARVVERPYGLSEAREGLRQLMAHRPAPTAIVCGNDVLAFGALLESRCMDLEVPKDLSIVGFDDLEMASHLQPALTTMRVPTETMWSTAADRLLATLAGETPPRSTEVEVALIVRESTGPARRLPPAAP